MKLDDKRAAYFSHGLFFATIALVLVADQLSKRWVMNHLPPYQTVDLIPWLRPILSFTYVQNTGVAFGLFPQLGKFFALVSAIVVVGILFFRRTLPSRDYWVHFALGLVSGGAVGNNLIDRLLRGSVVDFLDFNFWPFKQWAIFNIADSSIVVGVAILMLTSFLPQPFNADTGAHTTIEHPHAAQE